MRFYKFARGVVKLLFSIIYRIEIIGEENIPKSGGVMICSNHINNLDPPMVGITVQRPVVFMAKEELFRVPLLGEIIRHCHAFPVKRGKVDREALRTALQSLKDGKVLGIFPEGTRSKSGELGKGLSGVGFFALRTDAEVVPCGIIGSYKPFGKIKVVYGKPINFKELREQKISADEATMLIMEHIQEILIQYK